LNKFALLLLVCTFSAATFAETSVRASLRITSIHPITTERPSNPDYEGMIRLYIKDKNYGVSTEWDTPSPCRTDAVDVYKDQQHVLDVLIVAWEKQIRVQMEVDDSLPKLDNVCRLTAAWASF